MRDTYTPCYDKNIGSLNICLTSAQRDQLQSIINQVSSIRATGGQVVALLDNQAYFNALYQLLSLLEGSRPQTYHDGDSNTSIDPKGKLTIGIGFNLDQDKDAISEILRAINVSSDLVYVKDSNIPPRYLDGWLNGQPSGGNRPHGLELDDVRALFSYSMKGYGSFRGKAPILQEKLSVFGGFQFTGYQLLALQSLVFNRESLVGPHLLAAIQNMIQDGNPLRVAIQLIECSNGGLANGIENRRLQEASVFFGSTSMITVPRREQTKLGIAQPIGEFLPIQGYVENYHGSTQVQTLAACTSDAPNPKQNTGDTNMLGSTKPDIIPMPQDTSVGSPMMLGGDGDDQLSTLPSFSEVVMAGGYGDDQYLVNSNGGNIYIIDADHQGSIQYRNKNMGGFAVKTRNNLVEYQIFPSKMRLRITPVEVSSEARLRQLSLTDSTLQNASLDIYQNGSFSAQIFDFRGGSFQIVPMSQVKTLEYLEPTTLINGNFLGMGFSEDNIYVLELLNADGTHIGSRTLTLPKGYNLLTAFAGPEGEFIVKYYTNNDQNLPALYQTFTANLQPKGNMQSYDGIGGITTIWDAIPRGNNYLMMGAAADNQTVIIFSVNQDGEIVISPKSFRAARPFDPLYHITLHLRPRAQGGSIVCAEGMITPHTVWILDGNNEIVDQTYIQAEYMVDITDAQDGFFLATSELSNCKLAIYQIRSGLKDIAACPKTKGDVYFNFVNSFNMNSVVLITVDVESVLQSDLSYLLFNTQGVMLSQNSTVINDQIDPNINLSHISSDWARLPLIGDGSLLLYYIDFGLPPLVSNSTNRQEVFYEPEIYTAQDDWLVQEYEQLENNGINSQVVITQNEDENGETVFQSITKMPCRFANWCLDQFVKGAFHVAHEVVEAGGLGYGRQKSVYEACAGITMFNSTHVYHPQLEAPCPRVALPGG